MSGYGLTNRDLVVAAPNISLPAIAQIESSGQPSAIGDHGKALGLYQLHKGVIEDWNRFHPHAHKAHSDALEPITAHHIAEWYLTIRIPQMLGAMKRPITTNSVLTCWNMGCGAVSKGRFASLYIRKYHNLSGMTVPDLSSVNNPLGHKYRVSAQIKTKKRLQKTVVAFRPGESAQLGVSKMPVSSLSSL